MCQGCLNDYGELTFNTDTTSTETCSNQQKCICFAANAACDSTDGTVANSDPCICNTVACTNSNSFCNYGANKCSLFAIPSCSNTVATAPNTGGNCICGTARCSVSTGFYCKSSENFCSSVPCDNIDGSLENIGTKCACGKTACSATTGMFCYLPAASCNPTAGEYGYVKLKSGRCGDISGRGYITGNAMCIITI